MHVSALLLAALPALSAAGVIPSTLLELPHLNTERQISDRLAALSPSERDVFYKEQAELRKRLPDIDALQRSFKNKRETFMTVEDEAMEERGEQAIEERAAYTTTCEPMYGPVMQGLKGYTTCLAKTNTTKIDDPKFGLQVPTQTKWANYHIPPSLRGVFFMEGTLIASACFSTATSIWNQTAGVWEMPVWKPKTWSSDANDLGKIEQGQYRAVGLTFRSYCTEEGFLEGRSEGNGTICRTNQYVTAWGTNSSFGEYWSFQQDNNYHIRASYQKGWKNDDGSEYRYVYNLWRIVDENGKRTPYFKSRYLADINQKKGYNNVSIHLGEYQYVPQAF